MGKMNKKVVLRKGMLLLFLGVLIVSFGGIASSDSGKGTIVKPLLTTNADVFSVSNNKLVTTVSDVSVSPEIFIVEQDYMDKYFSWKFEEINSTEWRATFEIDGNFKKVVQQCRTAPSNATCWEYLKTTFLPQNNTNIVRADILNLTNYPLKSLTKGVIFKNMIIDANEGKGTFSMLFPGGFKGGEVAKFGFGTTTINTSNNTLPLSPNTMRSILQTEDGVYHVFLQNGTAGGLRWFTSPDYGLSWLDMGQVNKSKSMYADVKLRRDNEFYITYSDTAAGAAIGRSVYFRQFNKNGGTWALGDMGAEQTIISGTSTAGYTYAVLELETDRAWVGLRAFNTSYFMQMWHTDGFSVSPTWNNSINFTENLSISSASGVPTVARWTGGNLSDNRTAFFYYHYQSSGSQKHVWRWRNESSGVDSWTQWESIATDTVTNDDKIAVGTGDDFVQYFVHNNVRWNKRNATFFSVSGSACCGAADFGQPTRIDNTLYFFMISTTAGDDITVRNATKQYGSFNAATTLYDGTAENDLHTPTTAKDAIVYVWVNGSAAPFRILADRYDIAAPRYGSNSTNSTLAGTQVTHSLLWNDMNLSSYTFSIDNGTNAFVNDTTVFFTGETSAWTNITKTINTTAGATIKWRVHVNDSLNRRNNSETFTYETTTGGVVDNNATLNVTLYTANWLNGTVNDTVTVNASVFAGGGAGHQVNGTIFFGQATPLNQRINATQFGFPFYNTSQNFTCGFMSANSRCDLNITINLTTIGAYWNLTFNFTSNNSYVLPNGSSVFRLNISDIPISDTCGYSGTGNWLVDCSDNCFITSPVNLNGNNIEIIGTGSFETTVNIEKVGTLIQRGTDANNRCNVICKGGCFKN